jgi:lysophospholipase L1-like esterase
MNLGAGLGSEAALADRTRCSLEETAGNLAAVRRASEGRGVPVLFMTQVAVGPAPSGDDLDRLSDPVLGNVPEPSFDVLSLLAAHAGRLDELMQPDGCHATAAGHALIGQSLADWLLEHRERFLAGAPR